MERQDFKIDHYLPLCMGGSNKTDNLWPQHKSVYVYTDSIEMKLCMLMANGQMHQEEASTKIRTVKFHLEQARDLEAELDRMLGR